TVLPYAAMAGLGQDASACRPPRPAQASWPHQPRPGQLGTLAAGQVERKPAQPRALAPSGGPGRPRSPLELLGDLRAQPLDELLQPELGREAGRLAVAAAAVGAGDPRDVDLAVGRAEAHLA